MHIVFAIAIVSASAASLLWFGRYAKTTIVPVEIESHIRSQLLYQAFQMAVVIVVLVALYRLEPDTLTAFMRPGTLSAPARGVSWLGIDEGESWLELGTSLSVSITLVTTLFIYLRFRKELIDPKQIVRLFHWILLFSLFNSFGEEVIFRLGFIVPLAGKVSPDNIMLLSALFFGVPHFRGMPNGVVGASMASFLGWLLAGSVLETHGIFWAWFIHCLQDIVIYTAFMMSAMKGER